MRLATRLKERGWTDEEVSNAMEIMYGKKKDYNKVRKSNELLYWSLLVLSIIGNFIVCVSIIPIMLVMDTAPLLLIILLVGLSFGSLFTIVIKEIEDVDDKSHVIGSLFLPSLAIIIMYVVTKLVNTLSLQTPLFQKQNIILIPLVYVISFISPYIFSLYSQRKEELLFKRTEV